MKKTFTFISILILFSILISCDASVLKNVNTATETSEVRIIDWINETLYLCNEDNKLIIYDTNDSTVKYTLTDTSVSNVSYDGTDWYVLTTSGELKIGTSPENPTSIATDVKQLTQNGFFRTSDTIYYKSTSTKSSATYSIRTSIAYGDKYLIHDGSKIYIFDTSCTPVVTVNFTSDVYGFVAVNSNYYVFTTSKIYNVTTGSAVDSGISLFPESSAYSTKLNPVVNVYALSSGALVFQTEEGFGMTNSSVSAFAETVLTGFEDFDDVIEIISLGSDKFIIATANNGVYKVTGVTSADKIL